MNKRLGLLTVVILSILFLVACGGNVEKKDSTAKDTLVVAQGADVKSLDPHASNDNPSSRVRVQIYDRLVQLDDNGVPQPMLAESWERPDDTTTIFHLRKGVKFHNGDEMKASDVKFSLERALKAPEIFYIIEGINGIEVLDDYTVKVTTEKPMAALLNNLSNGTIAILSEKATTEAGEGFGQHPIGTGPYKFVSWQSGDKITLEAFPEYWQGTPSIKNVVFKSIVEETNRTIGLETGELDVVYDILGMDKVKLREDERFTFIEEPQLALTYLGFNLKKEPYNNPKVREAISYAIDQKPIIDTVFLGAAEPANSILGKNIFAYYDVEKFTQNIEKAKALMAEAGYPDGFKAKLWVNDNPELVSSSTMGAAGNRAFYSDPEMDKMLAAGKVELDPEKRKEIYKEIQIKIRKDIPMYMIAYPLQNVVTQKNIKNFKLDPAQEHTIFGVVKE